MKNITETFSPNKFGAYAAAIYNFLAYIFIHGVSHYFFWEESMLGNDSPTYITPALSFVDNGTFQDMIYRMPIYPLFLSFHNFLFGDQHWLYASFVSQVILNAAALFFFTVMLLRRGIGAKWQGIFGALVIIYPPLFYYESYILTECLAFFMIAIFCYRVDKLLSSPSNLNILFLGVIAGILPLLRPDYISIPASVLFLVILVHRHRQMIHPIGLQAFGSIRIFPVFVNVPNESVH